MIVRTSRVKVGNRQAPHAAKQKPHPAKVGFLRLAIHPCLPCSRAFRVTARPQTNRHGNRASSPNATMRSNLRLTLHSSAIHSKQIPRVRYALPRLPCVKTTAPGTAPSPRQKPLRQSHPIRRAHRQQLIVEIVARVVQHARTHAVSAVQCYSRFRQNSSSAESEAKNPAKTPDSPPSGAHHLPLPQPSEYCINVQ